MCVCEYIYIYTHVYIYTQRHIRPYIYGHRCVSKYKYTHMFACLPIRAFVHVASFRQVSIHACIHHAMHACMHCISLYLFIYLPSHPSIHPSIHQFIYPSTYLYTQIHLLVLPPLPRQNNQRARPPAAPRLWDVAFLEALRKAPRFQRILGTPLRA